MTPEKAVHFAILKQFAEPVIPVEHGGFFVYTSTANDAWIVVAYDVLNEVPHHFQVRIEKVDD